MRLIVYTAALLFISAGQLHAEVAGAGPDVTGHWVVLYRVLWFAMGLVYARKLWNGLVEREILFADADILDWSLWKGELYQRDTKPIRYWIEIGTTTFIVLGSILGLILGSQLSFGR